jgi:hypothetical protein
MTRDPDKAVQVFDLLLELFGGGQHWHQGELRDGRGSRCLVDALHHVRRRHRITGDGAGFYLRRAVPRTVELARDNDECARFIELQALVVLARRMAGADKASMP